MPSLGGLFTLEATIEYRDIFEPVSLNVEVSVKEGIRFIIERNSIV